VTSSHVPAIGAAIDNSAPASRMAAGVLGLRALQGSGSAEAKPDVVICVYNDHASAFSVEMIPDLRARQRGEFPIADEGWGPRPVPAW
jgi:protocatechuate 4,5-dioxygenase beta chain